MKAILQDDMEWSIDDLKLVAGMDISFVPNNEEDACVALVVLSYPDLQVVYERYKMVKLTLPYIPTFLAFREVPHLQEVLEELRTEKPELFPQLIMLDGNGLLHPRACGVAIHLGVLTNTITMGVGKTLFFMDGLNDGNVKKEFVKETKKGGDYKLLTGESGRVWGAAFRSTDDSKNPIYVSQGHRISLASCLEIVGKCCKYRIPEPVRLADLNSRTYIKRHF